MTTAEFVKVFQTLSQSRMGGVFPFPLSTAGEKGKAYEHQRRY